MTSAKLFDLNSYDYTLPESLIAQYPMEKRDEARLMVVNRQQQTITHDIFKNIGKYLPPKSVCVVNNSKVIHARLLGKKEKTGGEVEVFLLKDLGDGQTFEALLRPLKKIKENEPLVFGNNVSAVLIDKEKRHVRFNQPNILKVLQQTGHIPLPPYIKRSDEESDSINYQNVYAKALGSVAAPTAGLHFTKPLITKLEKQGIDFKEVTLHINYGTFKPVETEDIRQHPMHEEFYTIDDKVHDALVKAKKNKQPIIAVGTTSCRVLESLGKTQKLEDNTNIFIYPGIDFKWVDILITNFHLPKSTLLMLVCAFGGYDLMMRAYQEAIDQKYRFYSYGDAMIIL